MKTMNDAVKGLGDFFAASFNFCKFDDKSVENIKLPCSQSSGYIFGFTAMKLLH